MKERKIMEMLSDDISDIELPPISDKVLRALHDKAENKSEKSVHHTASAIKHKHSLLKIMFAAMLAFFVLSVPIIIVITNKDFVATTSGADISFDSRDSATNDESSAINSIVNPEKKSSALEIIKARKTYGSVCSTNKSSKELEPLLLTFNEEMRVYEDDSFIYNFDTEGNLIELLNKTPVDENGIAVSEQEIKEKTQKLISQYFTEWEKSSYEISIKNIKDNSPAWKVRCTRKNTVLAEDIIKLTFENNGNIRRIITSGSGEDNGLISKSDAIQIALTEIRNSKYNIREFKDEDVEITVEIIANDEEPYYFVTINKLKMEEDITASIYQKISITNGKIIDIIF